MSETPVPRDPGQDDDLPGVPADPGKRPRPGSGERPRLGSPEWRLVPQRPDWDEAYLAAMADDEDPGGNGNPKCRHDHRLKQDPRWKVEQLANGEVRWTAPSGRRHITEPTRYPI
jgi:hypothetical protein